jgi:hypothetical protein
MNIFNIFFPYLSNGQKVVFLFASNSNNDNDNFNSTTNEVQTSDNDSDRCVSNKDPFNKFARFYSDPTNQRSKIREENNGKIGVYA